MKKIELVLVDGSAFLFRAYFSNLRQNLTNADGFPTGAMFGVISSIKKLERQFGNAKVIMIFDSKGKNHRHKIFPKYKAHRKPAEDDLIMQIEPLYEIVRAMGYDFLCIDGVEADDTIATLAKLADAQNIKTMIASSDKDLLQLVSKNILQLDMKGNILDCSSVFEKMGVRPDQVLDLLALSGDSADGIPGVPSVGDKTAAKWLLEYDNITNIKQNAYKIGGRVGEKLRDNFAQLDMSYELAQLKFDVELPCDIWNSKPQKNTEKLSELFKLYGFNAWLSREKTVEKSTNNKQQECEDNPKNNNILDKYSQTIITTKSQFDKLLLSLKSAKYFTFDLETTGLDYMNDVIVGCVFLLDNNSYYLPISHDYMGAPKQLGSSAIADLRKILENEKIGKIGQNLKYDKHILANHDIELKGIIADTMLMSHTLNSTATRHNMDDLAEFYLGYKTTHFKDIAGIGKKQLKFNKIEMEKAANYACEDVIITFELFIYLSDKLLKIPSLYKLYQQIELPLIPAMTTIERNGVLIDVNKLNNQRYKIEKEIQTLKKQIYQLAGYEFNIDSTKQLQAALFDEDNLSIKAPKTTKTGAKSTNEEALKLIDHPIAELLLDYRTLAKLNSTYLQSLPKQIDAKTGRLHTSYHQSGTATGRLSSSKPNLQNIPIRTIDGANIRKAFVARDGYKIIAADYSQIELRIMAHISADKNLIEAFNNKQDVHNATASLMFKVGLSAVSKEQRRNAKAINFGLMYGMGAFNLAKQLGVSRTIAKAYIANYFANYSGVKKYMDSVGENAKSAGFVETIKGRRLYVPNINSKSKMAEAHALRTAINAPMQGSSADIIKLAMLAINEWIVNYDAKMIMQVHDELVFEVAENVVVALSKKIKQTMEDVVNLQVPLVVDVGVGDNWQQAH